MESEKGEVKAQLSVDPHFNPPAPDAEKLKNNRFLLLRHAVTEFNMEFARIVGLHGIDS